MKPTKGRPWNLPAGGTWRHVLRLLKGKARRFSLCYFHRHYIERLKRRRRGECQQCGQCCNLILDCPYLDEEKLCVHYHSRPRSCCDFPIDERDIRDASCRGFHFVSEAEAPADPAEK